MQNVNNLVVFSQIPSFYCLANPVQYYTFLPITPSRSDTSTPIPEHALNSHNFTFPPQIDQCFYYVTDPHSPQPSSLQLPVQANPILSTPLPHQSHQREIKIQSSLTGGQGSEKVGKLKIYRDDNSSFREEGTTLKQNQKAKTERDQNEKQQADKQYLPQLDRKKKFSKKYQENENRNVVPNEINQIFSFIQKAAKSGALVDKLFKKFPHPTTYTPNRYFQYQKLLKNKLGHYANEKSLKLVTELYELKCENWSEEEQRYYNKISRVLIRHFLYEDSVFIILTSKRMKKEKKGDHLRARRQISEAVLTILKGF